jgi:hypothetical protein
MSSPVGSVSSSAARRVVWLQFVVVRKRSDSLDVVVVVLDRAEDIDLKFNDNLVKVEIIRSMYVKWRRRVDSDISKTRWVLLLL